MNETRAAKRAMVEDMLAEIECTLTGDENESPRLRFGALFIIFMIAAERFSEFRGSDDMECLADDELVQASLAQIDKVTFANIAKDLRSRLQ